MGEEGEVDEISHYQIQVGDNEGHTVHPLVLADYLERYDPKNDPEHLMPLAIESRIELLQYVLFNNSKLDFTVDFNPYLGNKRGYYFTRSSNPHNKQLTLHLHTEDTSGFVSIPINNISHHARRLIEISRGWGIKDKKKYGERGNIFQFSDIVQEHVLAVLDKDDRVIGGIPYFGQLSGQTSLQMDESIVNALSQSGVRFFHKPSEEQMRYGLSNAIRYAKEQGGIFHHGLQRTSLIQTPPEQITHYALIKGSKEFNPRNRKEFDNFVRQGKERLFALFAVSTKEEFRQLEHLYVVYPKEAKMLFSNFFEMIAGFEVSEDSTVHPYERPFTGKLYKLTEQLVQYVIKHHSDKDFNWDLVNQSGLALGDMMNFLYSLPLPKKMPKQENILERLNEYTVLNAQDKTRLVASQALTEIYQFEDAKTFTPGQFLEDSQRFYDYVERFLSETADDTTGDTEKQRQDLYDAFGWLTKQGYWKSGYTLHDSGCGTGQRILLPLLENLDRHGMKPGNVFAIDRKYSPQPPHGQWKFIQGDFAKISYIPDIIQRGHPSHVDVITNIWSPMNDNAGIEQGYAFINYSKLLRKREGERKGGVLILEIPTEESYMDDIIRTAQEIGAYNLAQTPLHYRYGENPENVVSKRLTIMTKDNVIIRAWESGFMPINIPPSVATNGLPKPYYVTAGGRTRAFLMFEKVAEPEKTLDLIYFEQYILPFLTPEQRALMGITPGENQVAVGQYDERVDSP